MSESIRERLDRDLVESHLRRGKIINPVRDIRDGGHLFDFILEYSRRIGVAIYLQSLCESGRLKIIPSGNLNYIFK